MHDINWWFDLLKILLPVIAVIIAGFFALHRMRQNVKLESKFKWKEEFRNRVLNFTKTALLLDNKAFWFDVEEGDLEMTNEYMSVSDKLHNHYYSIEMMLNLNDLRTEMLHENYMLLTDKAYFKAKSFKKKKKVNHFIDDFYQIAKKIYDDNKYIDTLI